MARGYPTIRIPEVPLSREDIVVHPAAEGAFEYFQRFVSNRHVMPAVSLKCPPILEICLVNDRRMLIGGFEQLAFIPEAEKVPCLIIDRDLASHRDIEDHAWRQVLSHEPLRRVDCRAIAARFLTLQDKFPPRLVTSLLADDPDSESGTQLNNESLCRAYKVPSDSIRHHIKHIRRGGVATHTYNKQIVKEDAKSE